MDAAWVVQNMSTEVKFDAESEYQVGFQLWSVIQKIAANAQCKIIKICVSDTFIWM